VIGRGTRIIAHHGTAPSERPLHIISRTFYMILGEVGCGNSPGNIDSG
jgi:hypothetical protein